MESRPPHAPPANLGAAVARRYGIMFLRLALPAVVIALVWRELTTIDVDAVRALVSAVPPARLGLGLAAALTLLAVAGLYDVIAFPDAGKLRAPRRWAFGTLTAAWTNFLAVGPFGGPALRLYYYRRAGLTTAEITPRLADIYTGMGAGFTAWAAAAFLPLGERALAIRVVIAVVVGPTIAVTVGAGHRLLRRRPTSLPTARVVQLGLVGAADWGLVFLVFSIAARSFGIGSPPDTLLRTMMLGHAAGVASMIPGGIGSADAVWISSLSGDTVSVSAATATILFFRFVLYLVPWLLSLIALFLMFSESSDVATVWQRHIVAAAVGLNALFLLASAALPAIPDWLAVLGAWLPLGVLEASHIASVAAAVVMLFLLRGIYHGYRSAFLMVSGALAASVAVHFLRGAGLSASIAASGLLLLLFGARRSFVKQGRVPISGEILLATALTALTTFVLVGLISSARVPYENALWTSLGLAADASRFLRGALVVVFVSLVFAIRQTVVPPSRAVYASAEEIDNAVAFIQTHASRATTLSIACGDKAIWRHGEAGLVVYQRRGDKIIALGDPVVVGGNELEVLDALTRYAQAADLELVFYQVSGRWMELLHEFGFEFFKLGEEGIVDLAGYTLEGGHKSGLRRAVKKAEQAGIRFEVVPPPIDETLIAEARQVSDAWLQHKGVHELQFSVGYFSPAYLRRFPLGMAMDRNDRMVAFVNLTGARPGTEMTVDFVRYRSDVMDSLMDYVLVSSFLWARDRGYTRFSMGMAPLFDVGERPGGHLTEKMARQLFLHGEHYYNYQGLLAYKEKFHPDWEPRYMAYHDPWDWAGATVAVASLVQARSRADRRRIAAARLGD